MALRLVTLLLAVSFITFLLVGLSPIDPVQANVGQAAVATMSPERRIMLAEHWDVGVPILERYASWLGDAVHGDLGESLRFGRPVVEVVGSACKAPRCCLARHGSYRVSWAWRLVCLRACVPARGSTA